jgi:centromere protein I
MSALDYAKLPRTSLCHLLSLITRRKHVKPFRIQQLFVSYPVLTHFIFLCANSAFSLELSRGLGNEPALQGLLRVYKDYYPDIILGSASTSRKSFAPVSPLCSYNVSCKLEVARYFPVACDTR